MVDPSFRRDFLSNFTLFEEVLIFVKDPNMANKIYFDPKGVVKNSATAALS